MLVYSCSSLKHRRAEAEMLLIESGTRVRYDTLGVNGRAACTAMGVLIEHDITLVFHEEGQRKKSDHNMSGR